MSTPTTMPAFELQEGYQYVMRKSSTVLGQMTSIDLQATIQSRKIPRLGDTAKKISYGAAEYTARLEMYTEADPDGIALLLGGTTKPVSGGWVGTEKLVLNPSVAPFDLLVDVYDANTGSGDSLVGTWTLKNFKPTQVQFRVQADNASTFSISSDLTEWYLTPADGVGA